MKKITIAIFILAFFLIRPYAMQANGMWDGGGGGDDQDYFAHATALISGNFPSYAKEFSYGSKNPLGSIGPGLMAAPFVYVFSFVDRIQGSTIVEHRTTENVTRSWSQFGFIFAASFYFWIGCFFLYKGLRQFYADHCASFAVIFMVLLQGIPLFAYRRSVFSHIFEFFLQSVFVYLLLRNQKRQKFDIEGWGKLIGVGFALGLIYLVRYNNLLGAMIWPFALYGRSLETLRTSRFWKKLATMYAVAILLIGVFKVWPDVVTNHEGYVGVMEQMTTAYPVDFYLRRFFHIIFGLDWGLVYSAPFILIGVASLFCFDFPVKRRMLLCAAPLLVNFYGIMMWLTQGCWYGYRYFIAAATPLLVYPLAHFLFFFEQKYGKRIYAVMGLVAVFPLLSMVCFQGNMTNLTLHSMYQYFGRVGWGNNTYQLEIWKTLIFQPGVFFIAVFKGGFLYLVYLVLTVLGHSAWLPAMVTEKYPCFDGVTLIKVGLLYLAPFVFYAIATRLNRFVVQRTS